MCTIIEEEWRDIAGYEGLYQVSNLGRVKSLERTILGNDGRFKKFKGRILNQRKNRCGYRQVRIYKDGKQKTFYVHRLVAQAFIENQLNLPCVNHINELKQDNRVFNLEYCDYSYNINFGTRNKRVAEKQSKKVICVETNVIYPSTHEVQRQTGIYQQSISSCCNGIRKTAGKFHWKYIE